MKKLFALALVLALAGCASNPFTKVYNIVTGATVDPTSVIVAGNAFDALEASATNYLRLPRCTLNGSPVCRSPKATPKIIQAVRAGRVARNNLESFYAANPGALGPSGLYNALVASINTLQAIFIQYNVGGAQ
jgi:hypothetical protein